MAASLDKESRLATIQAPRLVLVGGSNLALGIDSRKIELATGLQVVNMGLHAGLGLSYPLNEAQAGLRKGDKIVLSIEYFLNKSTDNKKLTTQLIDVNPTARQYLDLSMFDFVRLYDQSVQRCLSGIFYKFVNRTRSDSVYTRAGFSTEGDLKSHFGKPKPILIKDNVKFDITDYSNNIDVINKFINTAEEKGAIVFFTYPAFPRSAYNRNRTALVNLSNQYHQSLICPILGSVESFVLPDRYFFDTVYHLDSVGVKERTKIMIDLLQKSDLRLK